MSFVRRAGSFCAEPRVDSPEAMLSLIRKAGLLPLTAGSVAGWSVEEHTPAELWPLPEEGTEGPWDWKIPVVQSGEVAYGKFLRGGKAAFATVEVLRELMNWRRSLDCAADVDTLKRRGAILSYMEANGGTAQVREIRQLLGIRKAEADKLLAALQWQTAVVVGDIERVHRGADLRYTGWQTCTFCTPEALFDGLAPSSRTPQASFDFLVDTVCRFAPGATPREVTRRLV